MIASEASDRGFPGLLNLAAQPHWTLIATDFSLSQREINRVRRQLKDSPTRLIFLTISDQCDLRELLVNSGFDADNDYLSIHTLLCRHHNLDPVQRLFESVRRRDLTRVELPMLECGFEPRFASVVLRAVREADYTEQDNIADYFFDLLGRNRPYRVIIETGGGLLNVMDAQPWFDIAGRLEEGETRIMPAGEVAYTGDAIDGVFTVDGAVLPLAEHPAVAHTAKRLQHLSADVAQDPIELYIRNGQIVDVGGNVDAAKEFAQLFDADARYCAVTEVGISFNRACRTFVHDWPAASNESRPGVHIGFGGDPVGNQDAERPLVHIDCVAANSSVSVNSEPFLRATS